MIRWIAVGFFTFIFLVLPADAIAGMAVSPLQQWVVVKPGKQASFSVTITNTNRSPETRPCIVNVSVVDFTVSPQGGLSFGKDVKHNRSAVSWISFDAGEFVLEPGESKEIKARVSAPSNADGDYWAAIMVELGNSKNQEKGLQIKLRTASGVFIHVARRNYIERGSVTDANVVIPEFGPQQSPTEESALEQISQEVQKEQTLKINAELKNDGLVAFIANGKAFLYSGNWCRIGSIPLYTNRRRIFPGHTRCFTGVMSQPLSARHYKVRVFFDVSSEHGNSVTKYKRKITKDMELSVSDELARQWAENFTEDSIQMLEIEPEELELELTPGRFTATRFLVANRGLNTVSIRCWLEEDELPEGWLKLKSVEFALAPNTRRNTICSIRVPTNAQPGEYKGTIHVEAERSGLIVQGKSNIELHKVPIHIAVSDK